VQFNLSRYHTKDELISAVQALPMINTSGNDISGAMRTLRTEILALGHGGHNYMPKVALTLTDERAPDSRDLNTAYQVLYHGWIRDTPTVGNRPDLFMLFVSVGRLISDLQYVHGMH